MSLSIKYETCAKFVHTADSVKLFHWKFYADAMERKRRSSSKDLKNGKTEFWQCARDCFFLHIALSVAVIMLLLVLLCVVIRLTARELLGDGIRFIYFIF